MLSTDILNQHLKHLKLTSHLQGLDKLAAEQRTYTKYELYLRLTQQYALSEMYNALAVSELEEVLSTHYKGSLNRSEHLQSCFLQDVSLFHTLCAWQMVSS